MASLKDLAERVKKFLTPQPLVSAQPWNNAGKPNFAQQLGKVVGFGSPGNFGINGNQIASKVAQSQPYKNLSNSLNMLTNPSQTENRKLLIQGLQTPDRYTAPATQRAINLLTNVAATQTGGYNKIKEGVNAFKNKQYLQAVAKPIFGAGQIATSALPVNLFANSIASNTKPINNEKYDTFRRLAGGFISGQTGEKLATNVPDKNIKILGQEFDPLKTVGSMYGFTKNPIWGKIFGKTVNINKWAPTTSKVMNFLMTRGAKGGTEGFIQALAEVPTNASPEEKAKIFTQNILYGAGSEIGMDAAGKALGKFWDALPIRSKKELGNAVESAYKDNFHGNQYVTIDKKVVPKPPRVLSSTDGINYYEKGKTPTYELGRTAEEIQRMANDINYGGSVVKATKEMSPAEMKLREGLTPEVTKSTIQMQDSPNLRSYNDTAGLVEQKTITKSPQLSSKPNIASQTNAFETNIPLKSNSIPKPEEVAATLPSRLDNLINKTLNYSTENPTGGTREAGLWTKTLRKGQESISRKVEAGMGSDNKLVRNAATTLQNFFRGIGMSPERAKASMELRGEMSTANERAYNVMDSLYKSLGSDKKSLERINAVLDPGIAKTKVTFDQLTPTEKQVYGIIREGFDLVHDTSYANGHISADLYVKNKGRYTPRLYDVMELPAEVNKFVTQGTKKISNDLYKSRKTVDDWKIENSLNDPVYGLGKRLAQVETNTAIKKYTDFLSSNSRFISDVEKPGFTKLSDSPAYGALSGKYVLNSAAEDLKGFFFTNKATQNLYDVFRAYDRMPIRQLQKKLLTVFNPTTNVGNIVSDQVFGFVTGVDPLTLNTNLVKLKTNPSEFKQLSDYLMRQGITGTDITRTDFVNKLGSIDELAAGKKSGVIKLVTDKVQAFYGGTDDVYKVSALKSLLDKGFSLEEATRKVADGFQNYANVGKFYDVWAKTPVVGSAFIKFQGDLMRIIKNGAVNNPLGLIGFLGTLWGVSRLSSKLSGESDSDRQYRENRFGAPMIPGLNIPLTWQTPIGEINAARYISPFFANNEITNFNKMIPGGALISMGKDLLDPEKSDKAKVLAQNVNDPLLSSPAQLLLNRDFRGKQISDPNENKYQASTLTPEEKLSNQGKFLLRSYLAPPINSAIDVVSASQGKPNMYGATQTVPQAVARLGGIKISQFGSKEVQESKKKEAEFTQYALDSIDKQIKAVRKQQLKGEITPEVAKKRIDSLEREKITSQSKTLRTFETSPEAPKDVMARIHLATQATVTNPTNALKVVQAIFTEEKMRKLSGDTLIFERETNLNMTPEKGDVVDHIIPLSAGGDNSDKNKRYISAEANQAKAKLETSLARKLANNEITGAEMRKQIKDYMNKYSADYTPTNTDTSSITSSGDVYEYLDDKGSMRTIDISEPIVYPELSGQTELDKKKISKYKGQITSRINDIVELNRLKQISDEEAEKLISELKTKSTKTGSSKKKGIKVSIPKIKFKTIKLSESKSPTPKALKLAKLRLSKANSKAYRNIKVKVASKKHAKIKLKGFKNTLG